MIIKEKENIVFKVVTIVILFVLLSIIIVLRIFWIQVVGYKKYHNLVMKNNFRIHNIHALRGNIYSADNILLATTIMRYHIYLDLNIINQKIFDQNIDVLSDLLSSVLDKSKEEYKTNLIQQKKKK